ncbi:secretin N-terminal domain-containing protein, partial [Zoogloea sp.]
MKRLLLVPLLALGLFLGMFSMAWAQQEVEIVPLKSRTVDQVLPVLQPLVEPGGAVSGMNNQLIIKGSRRNREQLKQVL